MSEMTEAEMAADRVDDASLEDDLPDPADPSTIEPDQGDIGHDEGGPEDDQ